ncbi:unnamed protein product [Sphagnum jensenii]
MALRRRRLQARHALHCSSVEDASSCTISGSGTATPRSGIPGSPPQRKPAIAKLLESFGTVLIPNLGISMRSPDSTERGNTKWSITVVEGVQDDVISHCHPGQSFGVTGIELDDCIRESTYVTAERTELLMLSKQDYDNILMIQKTPELKERVRFLKVFLQPSFHLWSTVAFKEVSKQSLRRLANVLSTRLFDKNRVVTFQGDDAVEMFFIKSGECRVIMEIQSGKNPSKLPRASSFLSQYWYVSCVIAHTASSLQTRGYREGEGLGTSFNWFTTSILSIYLQD